MTDLTKYRRENHNLLVENNDNIQKKETKKLKKYVEKMTLNLTQEESDLLNKLNSESGIPKGEIIRRELKKTGFFK